jgi:hypothetical protein
LERRNACPPCFILWREVEWDSLKQQHRNSEIM